jgi:hypothetical protein
MIQRFNAGPPRGTNAERRAHGSWIRPEGNTGAAQRGLRCRSSRPNETTGSTSAVRGRRDHCASCGATGPAWRTIAARNSMHPLPASNALHGTASVLPVERGRSCRRRPKSLACDRRARFRSDDHLNVFCRFALFKLRAIFPGRRFPSRERFQLPNVRYRLGAAQAAPAHTSTDVLVCRLQCTSAHPAVHDSKYARAYEHTAQGACQLDFASSATLLAHKKQRATVLCD